LYCDGSGRFDVLVTFGATSTASFDALGLEFTVGDIELGISRTVAGELLEFTLTGTLSGVDNLHTTLTFDLPFSDFEVSAKYTYVDESGSGAVAQEQDSAALQISSPGGLLAILGKSSLSVQYSSSLNFAAIVPAAPGASANLYYDMMSRCQLLSALVEFDLEEESIYVTTVIEIYPVLF
jgi:hypothetical protein